MRNTLLCIFDTSADTGYHKVTRFHLALSIKIMRPTQYGSTATRRTKKDPHF
jgi:hypothetical protein